jgi:hypothetical protein
MGALAPEVDISSTTGASSTVEERRFSAALEAKMIRALAPEEPTPKGEK